MYAEIVSPPMQPRLVRSHETICCGASVYVTASSRIASDSICSVALKAQHDPHCPWFITGVTAPFVRQSTDAGGAGVPGASGGRSVAPPSKGGD